MPIKNMKRIAAILLMVCFVLPLSRCERHEKILATETKNTAASVASSSPAAEPAYEDKYAFRSVSPDYLPESAIIIATFFWPLVFVFLGRKAWNFGIATTVNITELLLCAGAAYMVYGLVLFGTLRYGGYLAFLALGVYFIIALGEISARVWPRIRQLRTAG